MFFDLFDIVFPLMFFLAFGMIFVTFIRGIKEWNYNNQQPVLTVIARVVTKRTNISRHNHHHNNHIHTSTSTSYYVTFEVESGDRIEFYVPGKEYGLLVEGDLGKLTFQGTRFISFERER